MKLAYAILVVAPALLLASRPWAEQVREQQGPAEEIINVLTKGALRHQTYDKLAEFTDTVGNRVSGSPALQRAVDWMLATLAAEGLENVHGENATVPYWIRGEESLQMLQPKPYKMAMLGLGTSVATPPDGIQAEAIVVQSFDELKQRAADAKGKIVVYNQQCDWKSKPTACYGETAQYRGIGASEAAKVGAVASLVRSLAAYSIDSPHTGVQMYENGVKQIPCAAISVEDATALQRMQDRGQTIVLLLKMQAQNMPPQPSHNVVAEWRGSTLPNETVIVSGHLDSWDVGTGAMDDGGGAVMSWQVLSTLKYLGIRPKRTIRLVMWTCEEFGGIGSTQYYNDHKAEAKSMDIVMESDIGVFKPNGIQFTGNAEATAVMQQIMQLLKPINASNLYTDGGEEDNSPWGQSGVPLGSINTQNDKYFWFHHSNGDQVTVLDPDDVDLATAVWAVTAFSIANLDNMLPR